MKKTTLIKGSQFIIKIISFILLMSILLTGCRFPWQQVEDTSSTQETESEGLDSEGADEEPVVTEEPRSDLPPALVEVTPHPNSALALQQPINLYFNQPMDTDSVEAAIRFEPRLSGRFTWQDDQILTFTPDQALAPDSHLHLVVNTSAQAANKRNLQAAIELDYQTAESLKALHIVPAVPVDVDPSSVVFVVFNQPVVPLGGGADQDPGFTLSPEVPGRGEWLNTSTYVFKPDPSMNGGAEYTLQLNQSLVAVSGAKLASDQDLEYTFTTTSPEVLQVLPLSGELLSLDGPVTVKFNIGMDKTSVEENFALIGANGEAIAGEFDWDEGQKTLTFNPDEILQRRSIYTVRIGAQAQSYGGLPLGNTVETTHATHPEFTVNPIIQPIFESYWGDFGQYEINFTTPIARKGFREDVSIEPAINAQSLYLSNDDSALSISGYFSPETDYRVTIDRQFKDRWGGEIGENLTFNFKTPPSPPSFNVGVGYSTYNLLFVPTAAPELTLQATNLNALILEIAPISKQDLITLLHPDNYDYRQVFLPENRETSTHNLDLTANISEVVRIPLTYQENPLTPGIYYVGVDSPDVADTWSKNQKFYVVVSENNLVFKFTPDQTMIWGTKLEDTSPLPGVPIEVINTEGDRITSGQTDEDGIFIDDYARLEQTYMNFLAFAGEPGGDDFGFTISTWNQDNALFEMGVDLNPYPTVLDAYIYTDRPIYRPGDTVYFKAAVFNRDNSQPSQVDFDSVTVKVFGDFGATGVLPELYSEEIRLSPFGTIEGEVQLPEDGSTGFYSIELHHDDALFRVEYFSVAAYRKPDIELEVGLAPSELLRGDSVDGYVQAEYYFGMPASDQSFTWTLFKDDVYFQLPGYRVGPMDDDWLTPRTHLQSSFGNLIDTGEGITDLNGHYELDFSGDDLVLEDDLVGSLQEITLEVTVIDENGYLVSFRDSALLHPENYYIGVNPDSYFGRVDTPLNFSILTVDWEMEPMSDIGVSADFEKITWEVEETNNPEMPYRYASETTFVNSADPITNEDGEARLSFTATEPGTYRLTLKSGDAVTQMLVWVTGASSAIWPNQTQNQIALTADAGVYQIGDTAEIFFPNPYKEPAVALITIERGRVMEYQIVDVEGAGYTLSLPISSEHIPNVYVSVMLLGQTEDGKPDYRQGVLNLAVDPSSQTLNIDVALEPTVTEPGETVRATLRITDQAGEPVEGEFSLAVVDKAVLALLESNTPTILEDLFGEQSLSVQTSFSLRTYATQLALSAMDFGGQGGGGGLEATTLREEFPDTAFWQGMITTAADGTAQLEIPLPDSLTTWVFTVIGLTETYQVGQTTAEVVTQKKLMIEPSTPRFLVDGDVVEMAAMVYNNTPQSLDVIVSMTGAGFILNDATDQAQQVAVEAGQGRRVTWWGKVESDDRLDLVFQATSGSLTDASRPEWGSLEVKRFITPFTFSTAGQLTEAGQRLEVVSLPISTDPEQGKLVLELTPSLTSSLVEGLEALEVTATNNVISIASQLAANLNTYLAFNELGIESPQLQDNLADLIDKGLRKLIENQNADGGWSWWRRDAKSDDALYPVSDPFISAYALMSMERASEAGFNVEAHFIDQAVAFLTGQIRQPGEIPSTAGLDELVFELFALKGHEMNLNLYLNGAYSRRTELSPWALALLGVTMREVEDNPQRANTLLADLESRAVRSATGVHWEGEKPAWYLPGNTIFNSALGIYALSQLDPASTSLPLALQYLMKHRDSRGIWVSDFVSSWSLLAIVEALKGTGDYQADFAFEAAINDKVVAQGTASGTATQTAVSATVSIDTLHPNHPNAMEISRDEGPGTLYYRADLQTYQPAMTAKAVDQGIILERDYYLVGSNCPGGDGCEAIDSITLDPDDPNQLIRVALTLNVPHDMYNFILEDFIPAGTEVFNPALQTSQTIPEEPVENPVGIYDPTQPFNNGWGWWVFNDAEIYDDHVLWYASYVPAGTYILTYELVPYQRGAYQVLPAHAWQYFYPEVQGTTSGDLFTIN